MLQKCIVPKNKTDGTSALCVPALLDKIKDKSEKEVTEFFDGIKPQYERQVSTFLEERNSRRQYIDQQLVQLRNLSK